jgi:hypothetical protein
MKNGDFLLNILDNCGAFQEFKKSSKFQKFSKKIQKSVKNPELFEKNRKTIISSRKIH